MGNDLMAMGISAPEKILRTVAVYAVLLVLLRLAGKRDLAQLNSFDLVVMLLLSSVVQNAIIGNDDSLLGGAIGAATLIAVNAAVVHLTRRSDRMTDILEGKPTTLATDGDWDEAALAREGLRRADAEAAVRRQSATGVEDAAEVVLEAGGAIVMTLKDDQQSATKADVRRIEAKLDALLAG